MKQDKKEERETEPTCGCMQMLGFKTCDQCYDYQYKHVFAIRERERRWKYALTKQAFEGDE